MVLKLLIIVSEVLAVYQCEYLRGQCDGEPSNSYCQQLQECCGESFTTTTGKSETSQGNWNKEIKLCTKVMFIQN